MILNIRVNVFTLFDLIESGYMMVAFVYFLLNKWSFVCNLSKSKIILSMERMHIIHTVWKWMNEYSFFRNVSFIPFLNIFKLKIDNKASLTVDFKYKCKFFQNAKGPKLDIK